jgi:spore coat polysaccharide biosynthesis predicted glycosyltransferase SpsG
MVIKPRIAVLTEGGFTQGLGHIFRTLTIADELRASFDIMFLTNRCHTCTAKISDKGYSSVQVTKYIEILNKLVKYSPHVIIIDKPFVSEKFIKNLIKNSNSKLVIFDNDTKIVRYADIVVNALAKSYEKSNSSLHSNQRTIIFSGPKYLILRHEFSAKAIETKHPNYELKKILITFGGSDPTNLTYLILRDLNALHLDISIDVVLGIKYKFHKTLNELLDEKNFKRSPIFIYKDVNNISELMSVSDVVITHPGITMFEALYLKKPVIIVSQNDIQENHYVKFFENYGGDPLFQIQAKKTHTIYPEKIGDLQIGQGKEDVIRAIKQLV